MTVKSYDDAIHAGDDMALENGEPPMENITVSGGDGIDANSRTSYEGIRFEGGDTVMISTSGGNSAIDTEQGYAYQGGRVLIIMPSGGMTSEATHCRNFASVATKASLSGRSDTCLTVTVGGELAVALKLTGGAGRVIYLGSADAS